MSHILVSSKKFIMRLLSYMPLSTDFINPDLSHYMDFPYVIIIYFGGLGRYMVVSRI